MIPLSVLEVGLYLLVAIIIELIIALALGYFNKRFLIVLTLLNLVLNPIFYILISIGSSISLNDTNIFLILLGELVVISIDSAVIIYLFKSKYSLRDLLFSIFLINGFSFLIYEILRQVFSYYTYFN